MNLQDLLQNLPIPPRESNHRGEWRPLYLEPSPGSGERLCIGVVGADKNALSALPVPNLGRLSAIYSKEAAAFEWAAKLALLEVREILSQTGIDQLSSRMQGFEGFFVGEKRTGAGRDLQDLLNLALRQSSSLVANLAGDTVESDTAEPGRPGPIAAAVKNIVVRMRPALRESFGLQYRFSKSARPTAFGFVGQRVIANFTSLGADSAQVLAAQVDRAKARLWDLEQLQKGVLHDSLGIPMQQASFELLACPPATKASDSKRQLGAEQIFEAAETLEREADRFEIRWRYLKTPADVAHSILSREAA